MNTNNSSRAAATALTVGGAVFAGLLVGVCVVVVGIVSYFRLSSETNVLRATVMDSVNGRWDKKIALNVGFFTTG